MASPQQSPLTIWEHLDELRKRLLHAVVAVTVTFCLSWFFREPIFEFLAEPIKGAVDKLVVIKPTEAFTIYLKVSFVCAIFVAAPYLLFQLWLFIAPGLYRKEKGYVLPFLGSSTILFLLGGAFAYYVILPVALDFLINEFGKKFEPMISAVEFFKFETIIILGMGAIFQMPVLVAFLFSVPYLGVQLRASGALFNILTDDLVSVNVGMFALSAIVMIYVASGGLRSVAYVDCVQCVLLALGIVLLGGVTLYYCGGWSSFTAGLPIWCSRIWRGRRISPRRTIPGMSRCRGPSNSSRRGPRPPAGCGPG